MIAKILIKRKFLKGKSDQIRSVMNNMRTGAMAQPGYISGETLVNHYDPYNIAVVSTWQTIDDWVRWQESDKRSAVTDQLESLAEGPASFEIFDLGPSADS